MKFFSLMTLIALLSSAHLAQAQAPAVNKKLNLDDIAIKGELLSDDRMNFVRRQREELKNRVKFRTNFRQEILQEYRK
jgi:hypothetical protein